MLTLMQFDPAELVETLFKMLEKLLAGGFPQEAIAYTQPRLIPRRTALHAHPHLPATFGRPHPVSLAASTPIPVI
jgi:hypothetical protein